MRTILNMTHLIVPRRIRELPVVILAGLLTLLILSNGCKRNASQEASDSDANGYLCPACGLKFYTKRTEFPFICPKCGKNGIVEAVGFVCEKDAHMTIVPRNQKSLAVCAKCGATVTGMALPREKDLKLWGAVKY